MAGVHEVYDAHVGLRGVLTVQTAGVLLQGSLAFGATHCQRTWAPVKSSHTPLQSLIFVGMGRGYSFEVVKARLLEAGHFE
ncbi:MAG: hypothetical protein A2045_12645 [Rhodocyclales bacterium GWA2_65_20]|nr:MAG: hypothetical protein A2045_12645 [Rhodocyclales bacterium GWA2_65_20]